jgi:4'-phosphopantetheinyl transferase
VSRTVVVRWATTAVPEAALTLLTDAERARWAALRSPGDRARLLAAHVLGRVLVAEQLGLAPVDVALGQTCERCGGPHGRPIARVSTGRAPHLSLAHAGNLVVAVVGAAEVGVDVEPVEQGPAALDAIDATALDAGETIPRDELVRWWVAAEALAKARGTGWDAPAGSLRIDPLGRADAHRVVPIELPAGHVGAVAVRGRRRPAVLVAGYDWADLSEPAAPSPRARGR